MGTHFFIVGHVREQVALEQIAHGFHVPECEELGLRSATLSHRGHHEHHKHRPADEHPQPVRSLPAWAKGRVCWGEPDLQSRTPKGGGGVLACVQRLNRPSIFVQNVALMSRRGRDCLTVPPGAGCQASLSNFRCPNIPLNPHFLLLALRSAAAHRM